MFRYITMCILPMLALVTGGCHNDNTEGWIFGTWRVAEVYVDGVDASSPQSQATTFSFQNTVVEVVCTGEIAGDARQQYGTWSDDNGHFTLNFTHSDEAHPAGTGFYAAPEWLFMTSAEPMVMDIDRHGDHMTLTWQSPLGTTNVYELKKTW